MRLSRLLVASGIAASASLLAACTSVSSSVMVPANLEVEESVGGSVAIETMGTERQAWVGKRLIDPIEMQSALREAVLRSKVFDEVVEAGGGDQQLVVSVERFEEPEVGLDSHCTLAMRWRLLSGDGTRTVWEEVVSTSETVNTYEGISSEDRGEAVIAKAIRSNIREGIERLSIARTEGE